MKNVFKYLMTVLACALVSTAFVACEEEDEFGPANLGLGIKVFSPSHVVSGLPMTINGSGFGEATEIEFPGGIKTTSFDVVTNEMLRVTVPAGISAEGGKIIVRNSKGESAESRLELTVGKAVVSGFSKQPGETLEGLSEITVNGQDLQFIEKVELLDESGNPLFVPQKDFTRLAPTRAIVKIPNNIYTGSFVGVIWTFDGDSIHFPELNYEPSSNGGHWEVTKKYLWKNDGTVGPATWSGTPYRFSSEEKKTGEEVYAFPMADWEIIKTQEFLVDIEATAPTIRILDAWWSGPKYTENDIQVGNELLKDNEDGTFTLTVNLTGLELLNTIDEKHLLFAGDAYTILAIYTEEEVWIGGEEEAHFERVSLWKNDGTVGAASWSGTPYRFSSEEKKTGEEVYAFPMADWEIIKTQEFFVDIEATAPTIRILDAWWSGPKYTEDDIQVGNELLKDNEDGTFTLTVNLTGLELLNTIDEKHLLFAGDAYTIKEIYVEKWVDGGGSNNGPQETVLWEGEVVADDWSNQPNMLSDGGAELAAAGARAGQILCFYITPTEENWNLQIVEGHWGGTYVDVNQGNWDLAAHNGAVELELTDDILATALTQQWWGGAFLLNGDNVVCTKVTLK